MIEHEARAPGRRQGLQHAGVRDDLAGAEHADRARTRAGSPGRTASRRRRCRTAGAANSAIRITSEIGTTRCAQAPGVATFSPSTAEVTEIAGRDHPVAEEQAGAEDAERDQHRRVRDLLALRSAPSAP